MVGACHRVAAFELCDSLAGGTQLVFEAEYVAHARKAQTFGGQALDADQALELCGWNRQATAAMLGINRTTLFNKMHKYGLFDLDTAAAGQGKEAG